MEETGSPDDGNGDGEGEGDDDDDDEPGDALGNIEGESVEAVECEADDGTNEGDAVGVTEGGRPEKLLQNGAPMPNRAQFSPNRVQLVSGMTSELTERVG